MSSYEKNLNQYWELKMKTIKNLLNYKVGEHLFCVGMTGSGKSYLVNSLIKKNLKSYIIFDVKGEDFNNLGAHQVRSIKELIQALKSNKNKILYHNEFLSKEELNTALEIIYMSCSNITVIIDEAHLFINKHYIIEFLKQFLKVGRSKHKGAWVISQRGQEMHNDVLTQSTHKLCGFVSYEDETYMSNKLQLTKYNYSFQNLKQHEFFYLRHVAGQVPIKIKI